MALPRHVEYAMAWLRWHCRRPLLYRHRAGAWQAAVPRQCHGDTEALPLKGPLPMA